ncbi:MAG: hypothetical protein Q8Q89_01065 [bacterium]|nr:hypothetical protein [bacterium]
MATQYAKRGFLMVVISTLLFLSIFTITYAASTIGTNMSTTGTFTQTVGSATAARFQNAAGTTTVLVVDTTNTRVGVNAGGAVDTTFEVGGTASISGIGTWADGRFRPQSDATTAFRFQNAAGTTSVLIIDTTNFWVGIGATPQTTFEVQGTASASYFLTGNTLQVGGFASAAYSRFGTATTNRGLSATNDLLISGYLEVNSSASFDGGFELATFASVSMDGTSNFNINLQSTGDFILQDNGSTFFTLSDTGALTMTGQSTFSGGVSVSTNFEVTGNNRFGINAGATTQTTLEVGGTASISGIASVSGNFSAGVTNTGTSSFNFDGSSAGTQGACFRIKDNDGSGYTYLRVENGTGRFSTVDCR